MICECPISTKFHCYSFSKAFYLFQKTRYIIFNNKCTCWLMIQFSCAFCAFNYTLLHFRIDAIFAILAILLSNSCPHFYRWLSSILEGFVGIDCWLSTQFWYLPPPRLLWQKLRHKAIDCFGRSVQPLLYLWLVGRGSLRWCCLLLWWYSKIHSVPAIAMGCCRCFIEL